MESLRFIPVLMFLSGVTLIYCGFTNQTPVSVIRNNLGDLSAPNTTGQTQTSATPYTPSSNPDYVGVYYTRPSMAPGPRLY